MLTVKYRVDLKVVESQTDLLYPEHWASAGLYKCPIFPSGINNIVKEEIIKMLVQSSLRG